MNTIRIGGQAFGNGVLMRSKKHWALARQDGSVEFGSLTSWLDHHPRFNVFLLRSFVAFVEMIVFAVQMHRRNPIKVNSRLVRWIAVYLAITFPVSLLLTTYAGDVVAARIAFQFFSLLIAIWALSRGVAGRLWAYHGAEHKTINAYEAGIEPGNTVAIRRFSRVHQRCGTNLVFLILLLGSFYIPLPSASLAFAVSPLYAIFVVAAAMEIFRQLLRFPKSLPTRIMLFAGGLLQRWVTTQEPGPGEIEVAAKALGIVLALDERPVAASQTV